MVRGGEDCVKVSRKAWRNEGLTAVESESERRWWISEGDRAFQFQGMAQGLGRSSHLRVPQISSQWQVVLAGWIQIVQVSRHGGRPSHFSSRIKDLGITSTQMIVLQIKLIPPSLASPCTQYDASRWQGVWYEATLRNSVDPEWWN